VHVQQFRSELQKRGLAPSSIRVIRGILHAMLESAVKWELLGRNVCDVVEAPRVPATAHTILSPVQARVFLQAAEDAYYAPLFTVALCTGLRIGELRGLRWSDVDWEHRRLSVARRIAWVNGEGWNEDTPKTASGRRSIPLVDVALDALRRQRRQQMEARLAAGPDWHESERIFSDACGDVPSRMGVNRALDRVLTAAELPEMTFHELRHSTASLLMALGVHPKVVQEILGHSRIGTTIDTYSHTTPDLHRDAMDKLGQVLTGE
jgi:integrase